MYRLFKQVSPTFTKTPKDVSDDPGKTVKLDCEADGNPAPTYVWFRNGDENKVCSLHSPVMIKILPLEKYIIFALNFITATTK